MSVGRKGAKSAKGIKAGMLAVMSGKGAKYATKGTHKVGATPDIVLDGVGAAESFDVDEGRIVGGSYEDCKKFSKGENADNDDEKEQVHHMPADSVNGLESSEGPAITIKKSDHKMTASYDNIKGAKDYRKKQLELISDGRFMEAFEMDVDDIKRKFGNKYDKRIEDARAYAQLLERTGKIK